jgi:hypothetical protein
MNKLIAALAGSSMLLAVSAAQAAKVLDDKQLDTVTAGATLTSTVASDTTANNVTAFITTDVVASNISSLSAHCSPSCTIIEGGRTIVLVAYELSV